MKILLQMVSQMDFELIILLTFAEIAMDENATDVLKELRMDALSQLQKSLNHYKRLGFLPRLTSAIAEKKCSWIKEATSKAGMEKFLKAPQTDLEFLALHLHASRIFDNEAWVDFLKFNRKYRPEIASSAKLVWIIPECCKKPGEVTQAILDFHKHIGNRSCCPHCGRWVRFKFYTTIEMEERTNACE